MHRLSAAACLAVALLLGLWAGSAEAAESRRSTVQFAAVQGLTHGDHGTYVLLESRGVRLRLYPGTDKVAVQGRSYTVKDRLLREGGSVMLSARVQRFLGRQVATARAEGERLRIAAARARAKPVPKLEPLPVRKTPVKRTPRKRRTVPKVQPVSRSVAGDPAWIPRAKERPWQWIIVHHSDDRSGNLAKYDDIHRNERKWENGCGYHFVIGNGSQSGDGEVEIGPRWRSQLQGAHTKVPGNRFNEKGIGICLVGDFDEGGRRPTPAQMDALVRLVTWLKARYGVTDADLRGHRDECATECPGRHFPWRELRQRTR